MAASADFGQGTVTAIGFGGLFNDANMGFHWLAEPDADTLARYELLYALLRASIGPRVSSLEEQPRESEPEK